MDNYWLNQIEREKAIKKLMKERKKEAEKETELREHIKDLFDFLRAKGKM